MNPKKNTFINPKELFDPNHNGFSHIAKILEGKTLFYFSGQWGSDTNGKLVSLEFEAQVRQTVANIKTALASVQLSLKDMVKQTL